VARPACGRGIMQRLSSVRTCVRLFICRSAQRHRSDATVTSLTSSTKEHCRRHPTRNLRRKSRGCSCCSCRSRGRLYSFCPNPTTGVYYGEKIISPGVRDEKDWCEIRPTIFTPPPDMLSCNLLSSCSMSLRI